MGLGLGLELGLGLGLGSGMGMGLGSGSGLGKDLEASERAEDLEHGLKDDYSARARRQVRARVAVRRIGFLSLRLTLTTRRSVDEVE